MTKQAVQDIHLTACFMLSYQDSNLDKQNQKLLCYHYTIRQSSTSSTEKISDIKLFPTSAPLVSPEINN